MARHLAFTHFDKRKRPYWRDERLLGKTFVERQQETVLVIGRDMWTRQEMVDDLRCGNFVAAQNLSKICKKLQVESLQQLTARCTVEDLFSETGFGVTTMYVLMCAQESRQQNPITWVDKKPDNIVTLTTYKNRAIKHAEEAKTARRKEAVRATRRAG
jgi:hypothetical protein